MKAAKTAPAKATKAAPVKAAKADAGEGGEGRAGEGDEGRAGRRRRRRPPAEGGQGPGRTAAQPKPKKLPPPLAPSTLEKLRERLDEERDRHLRQADELQAEAECSRREREQGDTQFDEESGEGDTVSVERERDLALSATARQTGRRHRAGAGQARRPDVRALHHVRRPHPGRAARSDPVGRAVREVQGPWRAAPLTRSKPRPSGRLRLRWIALAVAAIVVIDQLTKRGPSRRSPTGRCTSSATRSSSRSRATAAVRSAASRA